MAITKITEVVLASPAASISVTSIPGTYTDLLIVFSGRSTRTGVNTDDIFFRPDSSTSISARTLWGTGSAAESLATSGVSALVGEYPTATATANTFTNTQIYVPNYASSSNKSYSADSVSENNGTLAYSAITAGLYTSSSAITSFTLSTGSANNLATGSSVSVYGVTKGSLAGVTVS